MNDFSSNLPFPYLLVQVQIRASKKIELELEALVDTGFGGGVAIPRGLVDLTDLPSMDTNWVLADGTEVATPAYLGYVQVGKFAPILASIIVLGDEPLIGRQVLNHFKLTFDHGQKIIIKP